MLKIKNIIKLEIIVIILVNIEMLHIAYVILNKICLKKLLLSHYDYHFIIKELAEKFEGQCNCLGENTEQCITFQFQQKKKLQELIKIEKKSQKPYLTDYNY